jgi:hypothetical protein
MCKLFQNNDHFHTSKKCGFQELIPTCEFRSTSTISSLFT